VEILGSKSGGVRSTAIDVLDHWSQRPRYGFVCDFPPGRNANEFADHLLPFHLNALQFYDWQFRHDQLVSPTAEYMDPLGRTLSKEAVSNWIVAAHERGMAAMAYAAVYAASKQFQDDHRAWALFDDQHEPHVFEGFLGYMNPTRGSRWSMHLVDRCSQAIALGFDGIHLDQYGEPRVAFDDAGTEVDLPAAFADFTDTVKDQIPSATVTLNAVKNWPTKRLAQSRQDFAYVEVWPDMPAYEDLNRVVTEARQENRGRGVAIALYIPASSPANVRLADAVITASGGSRIELGESARLLTDPYFPHHQPVDAELRLHLRAHWDLAVRYGDLLTAWTTEPSDLAIVAPRDVLSVSHQGHGRLAASLVNLTGVHPRKWDTKHEPPTPLTKFEARVWTNSDVSGARWITPDQPIGDRVEWMTLAGGGIVRIPKLDYWGVLVLDIRTNR
jgi:dextranase